MVGITPEENLQDSKVSKILLYSAVFFLVLSGGAYFILDSLLQKSEEELASLETDLEVFSSPENIALEKEITDGKNSINNFAQIIDGHLIASKGFKVIEEATHPQVWFKSFNFSPKEGSFGLSGEADSFEALGQQMIILKEKAEIINISLSGVSINKGGRIDFSLAASLTPGFLGSVAEQSVEF